MQDEHWGKGGRYEIKDGERVLVEEPTRSEPEQEESPEVESEKPPE